MIYSQSKYTNLFFFVPLKCGFSSFKKLNQEGHLINGKKYLNDINKKVWADVFIIRNPYDRVVSLFKNKFKSDVVNNHQENIHKIIIKIFNLNCFNDIKNISFDDYLKNLSILKKEDAHCFSLTKFYEYIVNTPKYILDINVNFDMIENLLGRKIPHENKMLSIYDIKLNDYHKNIIKNIYKEDFNFFYK